MDTNIVLHWLLPIVFAFVGILCLLVQNDQRSERPWETKALSILYPGFTLHRTRWWRYGTAAGLFIIAAVSFFTSV